MPQRKILVADDDADIRELVTTLLERAGHVVVAASDGREALRRFHEASPDLVVLDVTMPELDGWQTLERIRDLSDAPVLMLTAQAGELEKVRGLRAGADDYVTKPFGRQELVARVEALLRRSTDAAPQREVYDDGQLTIDHAGRRVSFDGRDVQLTPTEFRLLTALVEHPNQVLSPDQLLELAWGSSHGTSREQVKLYVGYVRRKLAPDRPDETPIETVRGFGYRYRRPT